MDVEQLLKALDNEENKKFLNLNTKKIKDMKIDILKELELSQDEMKTIMQKLKEYIYVDEMSDLREGAFLRWIPIKDPDNVHLTPGGVLCEINITDNGITLTCKNFAHKYYRINMEENLIFQKLSGQEQIMIKAMDYLNE